MNGAGGGFVFGNADIVRRQALSFAVNFLGEIDSVWVKGGVRFATGRCFGLIKLHGFVYVAGYADR